MFIVTVREVLVLFGRCGAVRMQSEMPNAGSSRSDRNVLIE